METQDTPTQTLFLYDNNGLLVEMVARQHSPSTTRMDMTYDDMLPRNAIAMAIIDYAIAMTTLADVKETLRYAKVTLMADIARDGYFMQNDSPTREDELPF